MGRLTITVCVVLTMLTMLAMLTGCGASTSPPTSPSALLADRASISSSELADPVLSDATDSGHDSLLWMDNFEAAKALAKKEGKDLFIEFTGSDWCKPCILFSKDVLSQPSFIDALTETFIFVILDFPQEKVLPLAIQEQNDRLSKVYAIKGYPTVIFANADGQAYARAGYSRETAAEYLNKTLYFQTSKRESERAVVLAASLEPEQRMIRLAAILESMRNVGLLSGYEEILAQIQKIDPQDKAGIVAQYYVPQKIDEIVSSLRAASDIDRVVGELDALLSVARKSTLKQDILINMADILMRYKNDKQNAVRLFLQAMDLDPESEKSARIEGLVVSSLPDVWATAVLEKAQSLESAAKRDEFGRVLRLLQALEKEELEPIQESLVQDIRELDPQDSQKIIVQYTVLQSITRINRQVNAGGDVDQALAELGKIEVATADILLKQMLFVNIANTYNTVKDDSITAKKMFEKAIKLSPASPMGQHIQRFVHQNFAKE